MWIKYHNILTNLDSVNRISAHYDKICFYCNTNKTFEKIPCSSPKESIHILEEIAKNLENKEVKVLCLDNFIKEGTEQ